MDRSLIEMDYVATTTIQYAITTQPQGGFILTLVASAPRFRRRGFAKPTLE